VGLGDCLPSGQHSILTPGALDQTVATMAAEHRYRRLLIVAESCESGALGQDLNAPGALLISAASPIENSLSTNYDSDLETFLADQFSFQLWTEEARATSVSLGDLYKHLYLNVNGSHVGVYGPAFGSPASVSLGEFLTP
jgi:glycosylphosphatidylinositol transamidase (GPIT) subunit GPI8